MTDRELKKLKRIELLELLVEVSEENEGLKNKITELEQKLLDKTLLIGNSGSIAEAALGINNIFCEAQKAADQYLENIRRQNEECLRYTEQRRHDADEYYSSQLSECRKRCENIEQVTNESCDSLVQRVKRECSEEESKCKKLCLELEEKANEVLKAAEERCRQQEQECREACEKLAKAYKEKYGIEACKPEELHEETPEPTTQEAPEKKSRIFGKR